MSKKTIKTKKSATIVSHSKNKCDQLLNTKSLVNPVEFEDTFLDIKNNPLYNSNYEFDKIIENDVEINIIPRKQVISHNGVPANIETIYKDNLLAKLCIEVYTSQWIVTCYRDLSYNGPFWSLPNISQHLLNIKGQKFAVDDEKDKDNEDGFNFKTKGMYLDSQLAVCNVDDYQIYARHKVSEMSEENSLPNSSEINNTTYVPPTTVLFSLSELTDGTKVLRESMPREGHVQEIIYLNTVQTVTELDEYWINLTFKTKQKAVYLYNNSKENHELWLQNLKDAINTTLVKAEKPGPTDSLERTEDKIDKMLLKIRDESEQSSADSRKEDHKKILTISPDILELIKRKSSLQPIEETKSAEKSVLGDSLIRPQVEQITPRLYFKLTGERFLTSIQFSPEHKGAKTLPEPFFISCCLVHVGENRRISETFQWNLNNPSIENLLSKELFSNRWGPKKATEESADNKTPLDLPTFPNQALQNCNSFILKSPYKSEHIGVLIRIDKVFNGMMAPCIEKYVKYGSMSSQRANGESEVLLLDSSDNKMGQSIRKSMSVFCSKIGHYRMPFCWAFCGLNKIGRIKLPLYRYDGIKTSDEDLFKQIQYLNADRTNTVLTIPGFIDLTMQEITENAVNNMPGLVSSELICKAKSNLSEVSKCCKEINEFIFNPLRTVNSGSLPNSQSKNTSTDASSVSSTSRPNNNFVPAGPLDITDDNSSGDLTPSGDVYNSNFFPGPAGNIISLDAALSRENNDAMSDASRVNQEDLVIPYLDFTHSLYVYPRTLNFAYQKIFPRARNLSCFVELRNTDSPEMSIPLKVIYSRPSSMQSAFDSWANTSVIYHDTSPTFNEEIKIALPINITSKHHLLFRFYHVSCDTASTSKDKTSKKQIESSVGYAWLPLLDKNLNLNSGTFDLPVAVNLVTEYLDETDRMSQIQWVDGQKSLFSVVLKPDTSIYTQNIHLHKFFRICSDKLQALLAVPCIEQRDPQCQTSIDHRVPPSGISNVVVVKNAMKALATVDVTNLILFLGPTFNQLFTIITSTCTSYPEISQTAVTSIITLSSMLRGQSVESLSTTTIRRHTTILKNYVKYSFDADKIVTDSRKLTVHDSLVQTISELICPTFRDTNFMLSFLQNAFLLYSVIVKSMIQSSTKKDKPQTDSEESSTFTSQLESLIHLIVNCILDASSTSANHQAASGGLRNQAISSQSVASSANKDLARFIARLFNVLNRTFIFRGIYQYMKVVNARMKSVQNGVDCNQLSKMKFEFLEIVCQHEHFIPLNLVANINTTGKDYQAPVMSLSEAFCQRHYLIGLVLQQVHCQMSNTASPYAIRRMPFVQLRNLLAKHILDDRYKSDTQQFEIARLYIPFISIILENHKSLSLPGSLNKTAHQNGYTESDKSASSRQISLFSGDTVSTHSSIDESEGGGGSIYGVGIGAGAIFNKGIRSSQAFLDKDGRVESHLLNMIAGIGADGCMNNLRSRRKVEPDTSSINSSTTLTGIDEFEESEDVSSNEEMVIHTTIEINDSVSRRGSIHSSQHSAVVSGARRMPVVPGSLNLKKSATTSSNQRMSSGLGVNTSTSKGCELTSDLCLNDRTQKDVYLCLMHILSSISPYDGRAIISNLMAQERGNFLQLLTYAIHHLKYLGKNSIFNFESISKSDIKPGHGQAMLRSKVQKKNHNKSEDDFKQNVTVLEGNLSTEVGLIVLDTLSVYCSVYKQEILTYSPDHALFRRIIDVYFALLSVNQSDTVLRHAMVSLRIFVSTFAKVVFATCHSIICDLSLHVLRYCDSRSSSIRTEACGLLYRMMRSSNDSFGKGGFNGVHLQMIVAVSKLDRIVGRRFNQSLNYLRELAEYEMKGSQLKPVIKPKPTARSSTIIVTPVFKMNMLLFFEAVSDLTQKIRTVLMATMKMNEHKDDPEMLVDLQYSLAKSYSRNPALRRTWLEKIYSAHEKTNSKAEMAMCKAHIVAMICEYLKRKEHYSIGCDDFKIISPNIPSEEMVIHDDSTLLEVHYSKDEVVKLLIEVAQAFDAAGLWEMLRHIYKPILPIFEKKRDYGQLEQIYEHLASAYSKIKNAESNNQRLIGSYYQVAFYGKPFDILAEKRYIYRLDSGKQFCVAREELQGLFEKKYGRQNVNMLVENYVDRETLDPSLASIHVTHVDPFFDDDEDLERQSMFERQYNISKFMLDTPFVKESHDDIKDILKSKQTDDLGLQWKRRTILTVEASFPHMKRRLEVVSIKEIDFSPIERAVDEIKSKNREFITDLMFSKQSTEDNKQSGVSSQSGNINLLMDMHLAGALLPQVNQGPMAYARVFLQKDNQLNYPSEKVVQLKVEFMEFLSLCNLLLANYCVLMSHIHEPKYRAMRSALDKYRMDLTNLLNEEITVNPEHRVICTSQLYDQVSEDLMKRLGEEPDNSISDTSTA